MSGPNDFLAEFGLPPIHDSAGFRINNPSPLFNPVNPYPLIDPYPLMDPYPLSQAPIEKRFGDDGAVFGGAGHSHFTHEKGVFHETTTIPKFGRNEGLENGLKINFDIPLGGFK
jgi:hypothetical protein